MTITYQYEPMTDEEKHNCTTLVKNFDDDALRQKVLTWWNRVYPDKQLRINENIYGVDLIGVDNPHLGVELERSHSWTSHHHPRQFTNVRIPMRKAGYWLPPEHEYYFIQTNADMTSCVMLPPHIIRKKFYNMKITTKYGYPEHFLAYYNGWYYFEL